MMLDKTMKDLKEAMDEGIVDCVWGSGTSVFAIVHNRRLKEHALEMWKVTP